MLQSNIYFIRSSRVDVMKQDELPRPTQTHSLLTEKYIFFIILTGLQK